MKGPFNDVKIQMNYNPYFQVMRAKIDKALSAIRAADESNVCESAFDSKVRQINSQLQSLFLGNASEDR